MEKPQEFQSLTRRRMISGGGLAFLAALFSGTEAQGMRSVSSTIRRIKREIKRAKQIKNRRRRRRVLRRLRRDLRMYQELDD